jgi:ABC-2 type transport system permease protein
MNVFKHLLIKEFRQIFRDPAILRLIFIMPAIQLLILPFTADYEIKNIDVGIIDKDHSTYSRALIRKLEYSEYFSLKAYGQNSKEGFEWLESDKVDLYLEIPVQFEANLVRDKKVDMQLIVNAVNGTKGNLGANYVLSIIREYNAHIRAEWIQWPRMNPLPMIEVLPNKRYNKSSNYQTFMVPGILAVLLTMVGAFLAALNIVKEKEIGTIEQLNVTPIKKYQFILAKLIPFWLMSFAILSIGLVISFIVHGIIPAGSLVVLYFFSGIFVFGILGFGLLVSNFTNTQQQAMMVAFFFMLIFILMSGLYTPIESMPGWAQNIAWMNPVSYMVAVMRMVLLKGALFSDILGHIIRISIAGILLNGLAIMTYRKRSG